MSNEEFVNAVKLQTSDATVAGIINSLKHPPGRKPSERLIRLSDWYNQLKLSDQQILSEVLREVAEMAVFEFFCVLDGVAAIEDGTDKGNLELYFVQQNEKILLNDPRQEELHNVFNVLCQENVKKGAQNGALKPYDSTDAATLKSRLKSGDNLDIHHVPDKYLSTHTVKNYDPNSAPAIAIPKPEHRQIPPRNKDD